MTQDLNTQEFLDPDQRETLITFLKKRNPHINEEMVDVVNRMAPRRVVEKALDQSSSVSVEGQSFLRKIEATNNGAKPGESFEDFLWRYIENDDVPGVAESEFVGLAEMYEKVSGVQAVMQEPESHPLPVQAQPVQDSGSEIAKNNAERKIQVIDVDELEKKESEAQEGGGEDPKAAETAEETINNQSDNNNMDIKQSIKDAQIDLVKEMGIDKLSQEEQEKLLAQMGDVIQQRILVRIAEEIPEDKKDELLKLMESAEATPEQFNDFVEKNLPNVEQMILEEVGQYKKETMDFMQEAMGE